MMLFYHFPIAVKNAISYLDFTTVRNVAMRMISINGLAQNEMRSILLELMRESFVSHRKKWYELIDMEMLCQVLHQDANSVLEIILNHGFEHVSFNVNKAARNLVIRLFISRELTDDLASKIVTAMPRVSHRSIIGWEFLLEHLFLLLFFHPTIVPIVKNYLSSGLLAGPHESITVIKSAIASVAAFGIRFHDEDIRHETRYMMFSMPIKEIHESLSVEERKAFLRKWVPLQHYFLHLITALKRLEMPKSTCIEVSCFGSDMIMFMLSNSVVKEHTKEILSALLHEYPELLEIKDHVALEFLMLCDEFKRYLSGD